MGWSLSLHFNPAQHNRPKSLEAFALPKTNPNEFELIKADDLRLLPPAFLLSKTHLVDEGFNVIFGPSGSFKSFYMLDVALNIAQADSVVYVAAEGIRGFQSRVEAWCEHYKLTAGHLHFIKEEVNLMDSAAITKLVTTLKKLKNPMRLIILDTYARCMVGGDENSAKDAGLVIRHCATIQRTFKTAVAVVHHANRAETGERGSGALRGAADAMIEVSLIDEVIKVECSKMKDWEPWPVELYRFAPVAQSGILLPTSEDARSSTLSGKKLKLLEALAMGVFDQSGASVTQLLDHTTVSRTVIYTLLSELKEDGLIWQEKKGNPFHISDKGTQALYVVKPTARNAPMNIIVEDEKADKKSGKKPDLKIVKNI